MRPYIQLFLLAATAMMASCMADSYDDPGTQAHEVYGNQSLTESNVVSIAALKSLYSSTISNSGMKEVTEPLQIKGTVIGNDIEGNIYNEVIIDDGTGAFIICIAQGGLYGYLPVGQEILVELKGLYIGAYGMQGEIGTPYTSKSGSTYVSRMSRFLWGQHYRLIGTANPGAVTPEDFNLSRLTDNSYLESHCGKLMTLRGVELSAADGKATFAPDDGSVTLTANCANRNFKGISSSALVLRTSTFADFAGNVMPTGKVDVTGIFTRFRNTWQILMRTESDIQPAK
ncbi:MAG: hypothetical protein II674_05245 [Prevotella sp.]|nr:hypothetical protein [Prevotella sp.]MBR7054030.1 hypothetical protein [Prevotella sp.]